MTPNEKYAVMDILSFIIGGSIAGGAVVTGVWGCMTA